MSITPLLSSNVQRESGSRGEGGEVRGGGTWEQMSVQNAAALPPSLPHGSSFHSPARSDFPSLFTSCVEAQRGRAPAPGFFPSLPSHHEENTALHSFTPGVESHIWIMMPELCEHSSSQVPGLSLALGAMAAFEISRRGGSDGSP